MGNHRVYKIEYVHTLGTPESEQLKVTALNLFRPTASSLFLKSRFFSYEDTVSFCMGMLSGVTME
jgi:hypothetical protein